MLRISKAKNVRMEHFSFKKIVKFARILYAILFMFNVKRRCYSSEKKSKLVQLYLVRHFNLVCYFVPICERKCVSAGQPVRPWNSASQDTEDTDRSLSYMILDPRNYICCSWTTPPSLKATLYSSRHSTRVQSIITCSIIHVCSL